MIENDQCLLYTCLKCHDEAYCFVQLKNNDKAESIFMMIIKKQVYWL